MGRVNHREDNGGTGRQPGAVRTALAMLEAVAQLGPGATAREIVELTGVPSATAYRTLNLLTADGYLVRVPDLSGFALGRRTAELAHVAEQLAPSERLDGVVEELRAKTRFGVHVASFAHGRLRLVNEDPDHELLAVAALARTPHANALGKVMLAHADTDPCPSPLRRLTEHTIVDPARLEQELHAVRATGWAAEHEETRLGRVALAAPVLDRSGAVCGGLYLQGTHQRLRVQDPGLLRFVLDGARELTGLV